MINGAVSLFDDAHGTLEAIIDFHLITKWKTAGDSLLGALRLARPESRKILIIGSGTVARSLHDAYSAGFQDAEFTVWSRTRANAEAFSKDRVAHVADDLETAVRAADIVTCATMSTTPVLRGAWLQAGQHVDLIGAYRPDMREADDAVMQKARVFVDNFSTTVGHIGEVQIPLDSGAIVRDDLIADYYSGSGFERRSDNEITLFKNGGGAHLDLMVSRYVLEPRYFKTKEALGRERAFKFAFSYRQMDDCAECAHANANPPHSCVAAVDVIHSAAKPNAKEAT
jgi:ornithine cyclodeaminase/alanine dehydrogenase-like protein (mu-crystallin family)